MRFVPEADVRYSGIGEDEDGEPSDLGEEDGEPIDLGAGSPHMTAQPSMLFLLSINSFGFSYGMTVSTLGLVILPSEAIYLYHDRCVWWPLCSAHTHAASAKGLRPGPRHLIPTTRPRTQARCDAGRDAGLHGDHAADLPCDWLHE